MYKDHILDTIHYYALAVTYWHYFVFSVPWAIIMHGRIC